MKWYSYPCILVLLIVGCASSKSPIHEISNPVFDKTDNVAFRIKKIVVGEDTTYVCCEYAAQSYSWANISGNTQLVNSSTGDSLPLIKCEGLPFSPEKRHFRDEEKVDVILFFPHIMSSLEKIDIIESGKNDAFNIYGLDLHHENELSLYSYDLDDAISMSNKAEFFCSTGNLKKAIELEEQALNIKKAYLGCKSPGYATSVMNIASYYYIAGDYENAILWGKEDLNLCAELLGLQNETYGLSLLNLATYYHSSAKYNEAEIYERQAIELFQNLYGEENEKYALAICNLAQTLCAQGRYNDAIILGEKGLVIREKLFGKESNEYSLSLQNLATSYAAIGDILKAISLITDALAIKGRVVGKYDESYIMSLNNLASFYSMKDDYEKAYEIEKEALQLFEVVYGSNHPEYAKMIGNLGGYCLRLGKTEEATKYIDSALLLTKRLWGEDSDMYAISLSNLSQCYAFIHDYDNAIKYGLQAQAILSKTNPNYSTLISNIAFYYTCINNYTKAIEFVQKAISATKNLMSREFNDFDYESKYLFWQNTHSLFDDEYPAYVAKCMNDSTLSDLYNTYLFSKGIVWNEYPQSSFTWKDIQNNMHNDDIVIEFISPQMNDTIKYYALTIKKGQNSPKMIELFNNWQFIDSLTNAVSNFDKERKVANLVWKPLNEELKGVRNVYFSPTHILHAIPIEYLPITSNCYYSDIYEMYRLSSSKEFVNEKRKKRFSKAVLYGGLEYEPSDDLETSGENTVKRSGFEQLFNSAIEVSDISDILQKANIGVQMFDGVNGTEKSLRDLSMSSTDILHIATHGKYLTQEEVNQKKQEDNYAFVHTDDPEYPFYQSNSLTRSFLVMSNGNFLAKRIPTEDENDGIVTALDISCLDFSKVDLVVLSACESALGELGIDDGILGLQRGFKIAGANSILMSLKKVDDEATKILMVEFYKNLMAGKSKHQSLKDAQKYLRQVENGKYDKPEYWASFIMLDGLN